MEKEELKIQIENAERVTASLKKELYNIELKEHNKKPFEEKTKLVIEVNEDFDFELALEGIKFNLFLSYHNTICNDNNLFRQLENVETQEDLEEILKDKLVYIANIYTHSQSVMQGLKELKDITLETIEENFKSLVIVDEDYMFTDIKDLRQLFNAYFMGYTISLKLVDTFTDEVIEECDMYEWEIEEKTRELATKYFNEDCSKLEYEDKCI